MEVVAVILTYNEEPNIARCLDRLSWVNKVVIVDSCSADSTRLLASSYPNVSFYERPFDDHTTQWNYAVGLANAKWVLTLDADYIVSESLEREIHSLSNDEESSAFFAGFRYCVFGKPLSGSLYPPRAVLFNTAKARYIQDGHTQQLEINGPVKKLSGVIDHDDRKTLSRWLASQDKYSILEAKKLLGVDKEGLSKQDKIRQFVFLSPLLVFFYTLVVRRTGLDGLHGVFYALQRLLAEVLLSLRIIELRLKR